MAGRPFADRLPSGPRGGQNGTRDAIEADEVTEPMATAARKSTPARKRKRTAPRLDAEFGAASTIVARRLATKVWQVATGEEPPTKK